MGTCLKEEPKAKAEEMSSNPKGKKIASFEITWYFEFEIVLITQNFCEIS
jgi:hypothetical protein